MIAAVAANEASPEAAADLRRLTPNEPWQQTLAGMTVSFGEGRLSELGPIAASLAAESALLVTDRGLVAAGHAARAEASLSAAGFEVVCFDQVSPNPTTEDVDAGTAVAAEQPIRLIVALGGGSAMDCAKGINFLLTNGGRMEDYWGFGKASQPMLPSIAAPTTAGTGSEAQSYALISQVESFRKMACGDPKACFRAVILDPGLLATVPREVAAAAGMDALSHALESFVTTARTPTSAALSRRAFALLEPAVEQLAGDLPSDPPAARSARARAALGSHLAGAAIEASMLGGAHAAANPLTARHGVPHGKAVGLMLPSVIRFNRSTVEELYRQLATGGGEALAGRVEEIRDRIGLPASLGSLGIDAEDIPELAAAACAEWTGRHNPRPLAVSEFEELYAAAL